MNFAKSLEIIRTYKDYGIELLLIGVILEEYVSYGRVFKYRPKVIFITLNSIRERKEKYKLHVDKIRGKLSTNILLRQRYANKNIFLKDLGLVLKWMDASGEFKEELLRLKNWEYFLIKKDREYVDSFLKACVYISDSFHKTCKEVIGKYTLQVKKYLENYKNYHINKEDIIYCGKGGIQYFFNMVSSEIMNKVYRNKFLCCDEKIIFLPSCMRQTESHCFAE